jgi:hypothetical protein
MGTVVQSLIQEWNVISQRRMRGMCRWWC